MKKGIKMTAAAAIALSAITPVAALAADGSVTSGIYTSYGKGFYTTAEFQALSLTAKKAILADSKAAFVAGTVVYNLAGDVLTKSDAQINAITTTTAQYATQHGVSFNPGVGFGTPTSTELKVESVSAINAKTIEVKFNQEMLASTINTTNITVTPAGAIALTGHTVTLGDDKKTVKITLAAAMTNNTGYDVKVAAAVKSATDKVITGGYTHTFQFADTVAPTVSKVEALSTGNVKVTFSEALDATPGKVVINGFAYTVTPTVGDTSLTISKADLTDAAKAALATGKSYSVIVEGFTDVAASPNTLSLYTGTLTYSYTADTVAPTVVSVVAKDEKTLTVTFSEEIAGVTKDGSTDNTTALGLTVTKGAAKTSVLPSTTKATTTDGKVFTVDLDTTANIVFDGTVTPKETSVTLAVTAQGFKDGANNVGVKTEKAVTVTKDQTAPTFTKAEYDYANSKFVFTTSEGLLNTTAAYNTVLTVVDGNGVAQTVGTTALAVSVGDKKVEFSNASGALNLSAGTYKFTIAKDAFKDQALNGGNGNALYTATVVVPTTAPSTDTTKPTVSSVSATNDVLAVTFAEAVKGGDVEGSATNPANYKLAGKALPENTIITLNSAKTVATITMPTGSISKSETVLFEVSNVQDLAGNVIVANTSKTVALTDTVAPELTGVAYDATEDQLVLTFSEAVQSAVDADFIVKANGITATTTVEASKATDAKNIVRVASSDVNLASGTITVTTKASALTGKDLANNPIKSNTTVTLTR